LVGALADAYRGDHGRYADDDAQHGERGPHFVAGQGPEGDSDDLAEVHGSISAQTAYGGASLSTNVKAVPARPWLPVSTAVAHTLLLPAPCACWLRGPGAARKGQETRALVE